jgi:RNA polymerase sigma factor (sigma-70 family)
MKDYYATLKIQQGRLKAAMQSAGIKTASELARKSGTNNHLIGKLLNFKMSPVTSKGKWRQTTVKICQVLGEEPDSLFPEHLRHEIPTNQISSFVEHAQLAGSNVQQLNPAQEYEHVETEQIIDEVLDTLSEREKSILKARFWDDKSQDQIGKEYNITGAAIQRAEVLALRKLRHPTRLERLKEVCAFTP